MPFCVAMIEVSLILLNAKGFGSFMGSTVIKTVCIRHIILSDVICVHIDCLFMYLLSAWLLTTSYI